MLVSQQPLPLHRVCPVSGAMIFDPSLSELALDQIKRMSTAMLKVTEAIGRGEAMPVDALAVMQELGR